MLREFIDELSEDSIPEILGERCVHNHLQQASCRACVDACPKQAWVLDDEQLGINAEACDNCGLCAPVCPQGAIQHDHAPMVGKWNNRIIAMSACEKAGVSGFAKAVIPCLHAFGVHNLLKLYKQGCSFFITTSGDCDQCERGNNSHLAQTINSLNALLESRALPKLKFEPFSAHQWRSLAERLTASSSPALSRRNFFRKAMIGVTEQGLTLAGLRETEDDEYIPVGKLLPPSLRAHHAGSFPYVPVINASLCNGCDACARLCPHQAVALQEEETGELSYHFDAAACTGCHICEDVCSAGAVSVMSNTSQPAEGVMLENSTCDACGVKYHHPPSARGALKGQRLCRICSNANHNHKLFQVYE